MNVAGAIKVMEQAIEQLKQLDQTATVVGHIASPAEGYEGDLESPITMVEVRQEEQEVILYLHY